MGLTTPRWRTNPSSYSEPSLRLFSHPLILIHAPFHLLFHFPFPPPFLLSYFYFTAMASLYQVNTQAKVDMLADSSGASVWSASSYTVAMSPDDLYTALSPFTEG